MRVLVHTIGSAGDVHPFIGVGRALKARGHDVHVITGAVFERVVRESGLEFHPLGTIEDFERLRSNPDLWHPRKALQVIIRGAVDPSYAPILELTRELHQPGNTVLLASSLAFGARNASELLGIPMATVHLAPSLLPSVYHQPELHGMVFGQGAPRFLKKIQWWIAGKVVDHYVLPQLNRLRQEHGLPPARNMLLDWWHAPDRVIALFPDWFAPPQPDWPQQTRQTGFPLFDERGIREVPAEVRDFLDAGEPPVIFTPGSAMAHGESFFREAVKALVRLNRRGILLSPFTETLPENLPPGIRHFSYVPFSEVLPRAAALVYHGGIGTCAQALQAGIPHLIQPMAHDQLDTLARVRKMGVGLGLSPAEFTDGRIAEILDRLLTDSFFKENATEMAACFEPETWMRRTCEEIEALLPGAKGTIPVISRD
ncbi:glycosyltransferase [Luteolibacter ambystomatis]|uniref:Glycosyltransferase n=1 Tax=Luteolibacter ambystomatis TaxID=2824561 RepID=A0A975G6H4_9BACT|nr:nucleotide disphospho-sugar-binding domain-containing protein [Luteolibacter ambystomatis]QUE49702.1 glycosyltransferase [Luteolibacter ambystomatis]